MAVRAGALRMTVIATKRVSRTLHGEPVASDRTEANRSVTASLAKKVARGYRSRAYLCWLRATSRRFDREGRRKAHAAGRAAVHSDS